MTRGWLIIHTRPKAERQLQKRAQSEGYTAFLPMLRKWAKINGRGDKRVREQTLFPRYLFVECDLDHVPEITAWVKDGAEALLMLAGCPQKPYVVPSEVIKALSLAQAQGLHDETREIERLSIGSMVRVQYGPYADRVVQLAGLRGSDRALVLLDILGNHKKAEIDVAFLRPVC